MRARNIFAKARFYSSVTGLYLVTLLFAAIVFRPAFIFKKPVFAIPSNPSSLLPHDKPVISGIPTRITVPSLNIDLKVDLGTYNKADKSWTLSDTNAQFAILSMPVNDKQGNTLIYGHNSWEVFGHLRELKSGATVRVFTDNGHIFTYAFEKARDVLPDDTSVFKYDGPPHLIIQTCSGNWNETRRLSSFKIVSVK